MQNFFKENWIWSSFFQRKLPFYQKFYYSLNLVDQRIPADWIVLKDTMCRSYDIKPAVRTETIYACIEHCNGFIFFYLFQEKLQKNVLVKILTLRLNL